MALARAIVVFGVVSGAACAPSSAQTAVDNPLISHPFVSVSDARDAVQNGATFLDARPLPLYVLAHPEGAVQVAWDDFSDPDQRGLLHPELAELDARIEALGVDSDRPVVVIGAWRDAWGEEARIAWMLDVLGHDDVTIVHGGVDAWRAAGFATQMGTQSAAAGTFEPHYNEAPDARRDELAEQTLLLDVRTREEFEGAVLHNEARGGRIEGARHLEWTDLFRADGALKSPEEIRALVDAPLDTPIAAYCTGGVRSAFVWAALEMAGYTSASNYAGSWWEYAEVVPE